MRTLHRLAILVVAILALGAQVAFAGAQDFRIVNDSGVTIRYLNISASSEDSWEEDVLGDEVLPSGTSRVIRFSDNEDRSFWDIRAIDSRGGKHVWNTINLKETREIIIDSDWDIVRR